MTLELLEELARVAPGCRFTLLTSASSHDELAWLDSATTQRLCVDANARTGPPGPAASMVSRTIARMVPDSVLSRAKQAYENRRDPNRGGFVRIGRGSPFLPVYRAILLRSGCAGCLGGLRSSIRGLPAIFCRGGSPGARGQFPQGLPVREPSGHHFGLCAAERNRPVGVPENRVTTIHIGLRRRTGQPAADLSEQVLQKYSLQPKQFLLYPANFWPHKNHEMLLTAFGMYAAGANSALKLVLTGSPGGAAATGRGGCRADGSGGPRGFPWDIFLTMRWPCCYDSVWRWFFLLFMKGLEFRSWRGWRPECRCSVPTSPASRK